MRTTHGRPKTEKGGQSKDYADAIYGAESQTVLQEVVTEPDELQVERRAAARVS